MIINKPTGHAVQQKDMEASVFSLSEVPLAAEYLSLMKEGTKAERKAEFHLGGQHVGINLHTSSNTVRMRNMDTTQC